MSENSNVALDGWTASGKTTAAQLLASELRYLYLDTGAMYRSVAYLALRNGVDLDNEAGLVSMLAQHTISIVPDAAATAGYRVLIDGRGTGERLFDPDVAAAVSTVAARPAIRHELVGRQRAIAAQGPVVMAGRDIGTVVLPDSRHKFFLTASVDERARRRQAEFHDRGLDVPFDDVRAQIVERDRLDSTRAASALRAAADAITLHHTDLPTPATVARVRAAMDAAPA